MSVNSSVTVPLGRWAMAASRQEASDARDALALSAAMHDEREYSIRTDGGLGGTLLARDGGSPATLEPYQNPPRLERSLCREATATGPPEDSLPSSQHRTVVVPH